MKYDFKMETDESTSVGKIVSQIKEASDILEFGPGNGRMTSYLMEQKKCNVSIVEFDKELYDHVRQFSTDAFYGNIDDGNWMEYFSGKTFDYIIFADVLEHLMNPKKTLKEVKPFLKENGQILITFPNLAHNSVLIDLFNNRLHWNETGLLDETHKSFYLQDGFEKLFSELGLFISREDFTINQVGHNEINTTYENLPIEIREAFKARPYGEVYQYFFALSSKPVENPIIAIPENSNDHKNIHFLFDCGEENQKEFDIAINNRKPETKTFTIEVPKEIKLVKIFPSLIGTIIDLSLTVNGKLVPISATNALIIKDQHYFFTDKQVPVIEIKGKKIAGKTMTITINYLFEGNYSPIEQELIDCIFSERQAKLKKKIKKNDGLVSKKTKNYKRLTINKLDRLINLVIDDITRDEEEKVSIIQGWAYDREEKMPLKFSMASNSGNTSFPYSVETEYRRDVIDMFELVGDQNYGFSIRIKDTVEQPSYLLNIDIATGQKIQYVLEKPMMVQQKTKLQRAIYSIQSRGLLGSIKWYFRRQEQVEAPVDAEKVLMEIKTFKFQPKISIAVPVYNVEEKWLAACVSSLKNQYYENWELCLADDASPSKHIKPLLEKYVESDDRIKVIYREKNGHISEATNSALEITTGDYIGFMDNDDELASQALYEVVKALNEDQAIDFIYTDEDKITENNKRFNAFYKSSWNPELILNHNYITHFVVVKRELLNKVGGLRTEFNGSQDYDFVLRATEKAKKIQHISGIMYHWRAIESSTALNPESKSYAYIAGQHAVQAAMDRRDIKAEVKIAEFYGSYKINYIYETSPLVSIIITNQTANLTSYLNNLIEKTIYSAYEILLPESLQDSVTINNKLIRFIAGTTRDKWIHSAKGEYIVLLDAGLVPTKSNWLKEMMNIGQQETVGLVTGKVVDHRYRIETVGVSIDKKKNRLLYPEKGTPGNSLGYYYRIALPRNIQAATEHCLLFKITDYLEVRGIDEQLGQEWMGVDLSLQFTSQLDKRNVYCSYAVFKAEEQRKVMDKKGTIKKFAENWTEMNLIDPYKNPNHL